jgi:hypothetical protein
VQVKERFVGHVREVLSPERSEIGVRPKLDFRFVQLQHHRRLAK